MCMCVAHWKLMSGVDGDASRGATGDLSTLEVTVGLQQGLKRSEQLERADSELA